MNGEITASSQICIDPIRGEARERYVFKFQIVTDQGKCFTVTGEDHSLALARTLAIRTRERIIERGIDAAETIEPPVSVKSSDLDSLVWGD